MFDLSTILNPRLKLLWVNNLLEIIGETLETSLSLTIQYVREFLLKMYVNYEVDRSWGSFKGKQ